MNCSFTRKFVACFYISTFKKLLKKEVQTTTLIPKSHTKNSHFLEEMLAFSVANFAHFMAN